MPATVTGGGHVSSGRKRCVVLCCRRASGRAPPDRPVKCRQRANDRYAEEELPLDDGIVEALSSASPPSPASSLLTPDPRSSIPSQSSHALTMNIKNVVVCSPIRSRLMKRSNAVGVNCVTTPSQGTPLIVRRPSPGFLPASNI